MFIAVSPFFLLVRIIAHKFEARILWTFYCHGRETNRFLNSDDTITRINYFRILVIGCLDILIHLPNGLLSFILNVCTTISRRDPFYHGWAVIHSEWEPVSMTYLETKQQGPKAVYQLYATWFGVFLGYVIFALFGLTHDARATYWRGFCRIAGLVGWTPPSRHNPQLSDIVFGERDINPGTEQG